MLSLLDKEALQVMAALSQVIEKVINFVSFFHIWNRHWAVLLDAFLGYAILGGALLCSAAVFMLTCFKMQAQKLERTERLSSRLSRTPDKKSQGFSKNLQLSILIPNT